MSGLNIEKDIVPLSKFRSSYKQYISSLEDAERNSLVLTQNGKAAAVLLSPREYDRLNEKQEVMNLIAIRLQEIANGDFVEDKNEMWRELEA
ncbi:MAG: type II toxin-antitoxin system Phd/YefM family antitoxin [Deltaproteobacteria bacterium]|jgi:prevent-host-death family protein|nr:type II toxin-antitoxin system Phd/YefM family antitoxin [Deltaproteobacteria bacterium]MBT4090087.1 type II toxin-antitoxin system Phd/YefM family antitoxin [Deltaproteobacteria bacterium]MBT4269753.1 type II toxin-antitoxin system Phd/YefM family antitoxin [Deltaproteobacteria bacterium]MBT4639268.1 type II toxin-antitoxin system Phd/YefM family antitoxin [Deltaproteobacteria bacterium]MBT6504114.1 type II toxin-antitoxin system Phd/YefM family antitoxin [Deltaproteobacteria bacterium]